MSDRGPTTTAAGAAAAALSETTHTIRLALITGCHIAPPTLLLARPSGPLSDHSSSKPVAPQKTLKTRELDMNHNNNTNPRKSGCGRRPLPSSNDSQRNSKSGNNKKQKIESYDDSMDGLLVGLENEKPVLVVQNFFDNGEFPFDTVLSILQGCRPNFATMTSWQEFSYTSYISGSPISGRASILSLALLMCQPTINNNLDMVKSIYQLLHPEAIHQPGRKYNDEVEELEEPFGVWENDWTMFPLNLACRDSFSDDIIDFLAEKTKAHDFDYGGGGAKALHDFSLSTIRILLERYPTLLPPFTLSNGRKDDNNNDSSCYYRISGREMLEDLNRTVYSPETYASVLELLPTQKEISIYDPSLCYNESETNQLKKVLASMSVKRLIVKMYNPSSQDIQFVYSLLAPHRNDNDDDDNISNNEEEEEHGPGVSSSSSSSSSLSSIPSLQLHYTPFQRNFNAYDRGNSEDIFELVLSLLESNCGLEELTVCSRGNLCYDSPSPINLEEKDLLRLCDVLGKKATKLRSLTFDPPCIKTPKPMQAFAKVLQNKNITLQYHSIMDENKLGKYPSYKKAIYYAELNKYGRRLEGSGRCVLKVQDPLFPITEFVSLLASVKKNCKGKKGEKKLCHQVQYELLRQSPGLWSPYGAC